MSVSHKIVSSFIVSLDWSLHCYNWNIFMKYSWLLNFRFQSYLLFHSPKVRSGRGREMIWHIVKLSTLNWWHWERVVCAVCVTTVWFVIHIRTGSASGWIFSQSPILQRAHMSWCLLLPCLQLLLLFESLIHLCHTEKVNRLWILFHPFCSAM